MKAVRLALQILLPVTILVLAWFLSQQILRLSKPPVVASGSFVGPAVRVVTATAADVRIDVETQGTVEPLRTLDLATEVGGRIVEMSPSLRAGGFFAKGDLLVGIERADYELAIVQQEANVARAELRLLQERAEASAAVRAWQELEGETPADPLVTRVPQIHDAEASVAAANAQLGRAKLDLDRTRLLAPFPGRVLNARVDLGQLVQPGQTLAQIYDIEFVEIRLPIPAADAAFLNLPIYWTDKPASRGATIDFTAEFGGERHHWTGEIVRTGGEVDRRTRQVSVIARVAAPYARGDSASRPPLAVGMFVQARIEGRQYPGVVALPRTALHGDSEVWVVDAEHRLQRRRVEILRGEADRVLLRSGVVAGESVCITPLELPTDGMPVRPTAADEPAATPRKGQ